MNKLIELAAWTLKAKPPRENGGEVVVAYGGTPRDTRPLFERVQEDLNMPTFSQERITELETEITKIEENNADFIEFRSRLDSIGMKQVGTKSRMQLDTKLKTLHQEKDKHASVRYCIEQYAEKFPTYMFIPADRLTNVCNKHQLSLDFLPQFIGTIPDKNLKEVETFLDTFDVEKVSLFTQRVKVRRTTDSTRSLTRGIDTYYEVITKEQYISSYDPIIADGKRLVDVSRVDGIKLGKFPDLMIVAPFSHFKSHEIGKKEWEISNYDPIILHPVKDGFIMVTAWGEEAKIPTFQNPVSN